jgi:hypothetical protein
MTSLRRVFLTSYCDSCAIWRRFVIDKWRAEPRSEGLAQSLRLVSLAFRDGRIQVVPATPDLFVEFETSSARTSAGVR